MSHFLKRYGRNLFRALDNAVLLWGVISNTSCIPMMMNSHSGATGVVLREEDEEPT